MSHRNTVPYHTYSTLATAYGNTIRYAKTWVVTEERMMNDQGPNWGPNGALSESHSVTTDELLVNRLGDTVLWFNKLKYW